jgi:hypothetical protein
MQIRFVNENERVRIEGLRNDMPWLVARDRFIGFFENEERGEGLYEYVEKNHGCSATSNTEWAIAVNSIITILNKLEDNASEFQVIEAFGLGQYV